MIEYITALEEKKEKAHFIEDWVFTSSCRCCGGPIFVNKKLATKDGLPIVLRTCHGKCEMGGPGIISSNLEA